MMHCLAFRIASSGTVVNTQTPAVVGDVFTRTNGNFLPQRNVSVYAAFACGATLTRARIVTPSLRQVTIPDILPIEGTEEPPSNANIMDLRSNPLQLKALEEIEVQTTDSAGTDEISALLFVGDSLIPAPAGQVLTMRATSTTAAVAGAWTTLTLVQPDSLPNGRYAIVGLTHVAVAAVAARLIIDGQAWRPGALSIGTAVDKPPTIFLNGGMGDIGRFEQTAMPQVEVFCLATSAVHVIEMQIVRVA